MKKEVKKRYIATIEKMVEAKRKGDMTSFCYYSGVVSGIRTGVFLSTDMPLDEYKWMTNIEDEALKEV